MKKCTKCKELKDESEFNKKKGKLRSQCKSCDKLDNNKHKQLNPNYGKDNYNKNKSSGKIYEYEHSEEYKEKRKTHNKNYKEEHKEELKEKAIVYNDNKTEEQKQHTKELHKIYVRKRTKERYANDPVYNLRRRISASIRSRLKNMGYTKSSMAYEYLCCTFEEFKVHIENQFTEGMGWDNMKLWQLDHIYPTSRAIDINHLIELYHYTNFQPLWAEDNRRKSNKLPEEFLSINNTITII